MIGLREQRRSGAGGVKTTTKWAAVLDMIWGIAKACGTDVELAVNPNMFQAMAMEACFIVAGVSWGGGVHLKLPVQWASLCSMACNSSSERGEEEAVSLFGVRIGEVSDRSLQYHSTSSANASIPNWYMAKKRSPSSSSWMKQRICLQRV